jgi:hypothetical protein
MVILVGLTVLPHAPVHIPGERTHWGEQIKGYFDENLYADILHDTENGANYYEAAFREQRAHDYPTRPVFAVREPTLTYCLVLLRYQVLRYTLLLSLYAAIIIKLLQIVRQYQATGPVRIATIAAAVSGLSIVGAIGAIYLTEVWAALLIAASLIFYQAKRFWPSVLLGLVACLFRELALPYLFVMMFIAFAHNRKAETLTWVGAILVFLACYAFHFLQVSQLYRPGDLASQGWVRMNGWNFVVAAARWNILLNALPAPAVALAICLAVIGLVGSLDERAQRAACVTVGYMAGLCVFGRLENYYWAQLYTPLLPLGWILALPALRDLFSRSAAAVSEPLP